MASKSISSALMGLKTMSAMRAASQQKHIAEPTPDQEELVTSILHPDNQKALAAQGYYSKKYNNKIKLSEANVNAASKREMFSKIHKRSMWSFVETSENEKSDSVSTEDSKSKNHGISFSTSMDSSDQSVWTSDSHSTSDVYKHSDEVTKSLDSSSSIGHERRKQVDGLMNNLTDDGDYTVTPVPSHQSSMEKIPVIESSPVIQYSPDALSGKKHREHTVKIVVHRDPDCTGELDQSPVTMQTSPFQAKVNGTQALLAIVNLAVDRLSDSGSDYTVVGMESPRPSFDTPQNSVTRSDTVFSEESSEELPPLAVESSKDGGHLESGGHHLSVKFADENENYPAVTSDNYPTETSDNYPAGTGYIYPCDSQDKNRKDAQENHPNVAHEIHEAEMLLQKRLKKADLPRMGSVQSDSSGFGDADVSADTNIIDTIELPRVCSLGSSSESVGTLSSNATILSQQPIQNNSNLPTSDVGDHAIAVAVSQTENQQFSRSSQAPNVSVTTDPQKFISWFFIPPLKTTYRHQKKQEQKQPFPVTPKLSSSEQSLRYVKNKSFLSLPKSQLQVPPRETMQDRLSPPRETTLLMQDRLSPLSAMHGKFSSKPRKDNYTSSDDNLSGDEQSYSPSKVPWHSSPDDVFSTTYPSSFSQYATGSSQHNTHSVDFGSKVSLTEESDYSSVADSTASCSNVELLEYRKLVRLINHPSRTLHGKKRNVPRYRAKKPIRDWTTLVRKKRIQEETRLLQHAINKYKTELLMCEATFSLKHQAAFDDLTQDEKDEVDEVQHLWSEIRQQILNTEQLLSARMKGVNTGNDFFSYLSTFDVIQKTIDLLKEQMYHEQISSEHDSEEEGVADDDKATAAASHWPEFEQPPPSWGSPYSSPHSTWRSLPTVREDSSPNKLLQNSMEELRGSLIEEIRLEMSRSTQQLNIDMQARDNEIHRLQLELMLKDMTRTRQSPHWSYAPLLRPSKQTDV